MIKKLISTIIREMSIKITMNSHLTYFMMAILKNEKCFRKVQEKKEPYTLSEMAVATHSSTLAWKIPWMEEPGRLQSMGSQRVGHD